MPDSVLSELAHQVLELANSKEHIARRKLWVDFHALHPSRALVHYAMYDRVWEREIVPPEFFRHKTGLKHQIEAALRAKIWKAENIPDDEPVLPTIWLFTQHPDGEDRLWGVKTENYQTWELGSYKPEPVIQEESDLSFLHYPVYEELKEERIRCCREVSEWVDGILPIKFRSDELHYGPFEWAVRLRGMDHLLYDVYDRPEFVHRLMDFITTGMVQYHKEREAAGAVDAEDTLVLHPVYDEVPFGSGDKLCQSWTYVHAQSSVSLSPAMYEEFVQPYNARIAELFYRVYYHGCEDLSKKCRIIQNLPHLRLFHVSPWTPVEPVVNTLGNRFALEIHSHPTEVLFTDSLDEVKQHLKERHQEAKGVIHNLKLCDVETVEGHADRLKKWAEFAQEIVRE